MKFVQRIGPFSDEQIVFEEKGVNYLQLGIEHPHSIPIPWLTEDQVEEQLGNLEVNEGTYDSIGKTHCWPYVLFIGLKNEQDEQGDKQKEICLTDKDILELNFNRQSVQIIVHETNNPYIILNISYEIAD